MKCTICKIGELQKGLVTVTLQKGESVIVIKEVPAEVCNNCGEYVLSSEVTKAIMDKAEQAVANNAEVEIIKYAA